MKLEKRISKIEEKAFDASIKPSPELMKAMEDGVCAIKDENSRILFNGYMDNVRNYAIKSKNSMRAFENILNELPGNFRNSVIIALKNVLE